MVRLVGLLLRMTFDFLCVLVGFCLLVMPSHGSCIWFRGALTVEARVTLMPGQHFCCCWTGQGFIRPLSLKALLETFPSFLMLCEFDPLRGHVHGRGRRPAAVAERRRDDTRADTGALCG